MRKMGVKYRETAVKGKVKSLRAFYINYFNNIKYTQPFPWVKGHGGNRASMTLTLVKEHWNWWHVGDDTAEGLIGKAYTQGVTDQLLPLIKSDKAHKKVNVIRGGERYYMILKGKKILKYKVGWHLPKITSIAINRLHELEKFLKLIRCNGLKILKSSILWSNLLKLTFELYLKLK